MCNVHEVLNAVAYVLYVGQNVRTSLAEVVKTCCSHQRIVGVRVGYVLLSKLRKPILQCSSQHGNQLASALSNMTAHPLRHRNELIFGGVTIDATTAPTVEVASGGMGGGGAAMASATACPSAPDIWPDVWPMAVVV